MQTFTNDLSELNTNRQDENIDNLVMEINSMRNDIEESINQKVK